MATIQSPPWKLVETSISLTESYVTIYTAPANTLALVAQIAVWSNSSSYHTNLLKYARQLDGSGTVALTGVTSNPGASTMSSAFTNFCAIGNTSYGVTFPAMALIFFTWRYSPL